ncbi:uncharacterized protein LACBIDRAFT_310170 [Laccaria bicolor S238N-H82]|uniref:Predicted protein n=1 Tax=Laccaria bicolor (strain S238N-H82 / ATCC MYA-4686) TaxID=486041 RepID=B0DU02_LACBS|nr:uncharacterized protein LACBIDRAFT_310170 [Laccaria bicolor S238N-H82]EDR02002.1 predicted protein [Laccaria bicolor S238N-H82]|eukprot:XP_001887393.1 predicted protein [Laccaria bicolor S238N-H82]
MKLSLRELCDPLVPNEMYNECIQHSRDHLACICIVEQLPTINVKPLCPRGCRDIKKRPRVDFFGSERWAEPTTQRNQARVYFRKYDVTIVTLSSCPRASRC